MQAILAVTVPFFALVLAGWLAARRGVLPESAIPGLNAYVLYFALPCMLLRFGMNTPVLDLLNPFVLAVYVLCALVVVGFTIAVTLNATIGLKDASFGALVAAFPNTGFMGVPLLVALLGPAAAGPVICTVLADLFVTSSVCIALSQLQGAGAGASGGARAAALRAVRGALSNPLPWSIALGAVLSITGALLIGVMVTVVVCTTHSFGVPPSQTWMPTSHEAGGVGPVGVKLYAPVPATMAAPAQVLVPASVHVWPRPSGSVRSAS